MACTDEIILCPSGTENLFEAPKITESDEEEAKEERSLIDVAASDDEDLCIDWVYDINFIASVYCIVQHHQKICEKIKLTFPLFNAPPSTS